jgi:hypothetical protein
MNQVGRDPELDRQIGDLTVALRSTLELYRRTQRVLFAHLPPDGPDDAATISSLMSLLDGCEQRAVVRAATAALDLAGGKEPILEPRPGAPCSEA